MCGILGTLPGDNTSRFTHSLNTLAHRGPDSSGILHNKEISLGHRRLSILDLSDDGRQPMHYANKRFTIVFNGEIYNFLELKDELSKKGYAFQSTSDTEIILASFIEWGKDCLLKFNGMWAFAIWDSKEKELFLSRDRFGIKPLFYAFVGEKFVFASEMKAIFLYLKEIKPSNDILLQIRNDNFDYESTEKCIIDGISRFPAGHWGIYKNKKLTLTRYWETLDHLVDVPDKYEDQVQKFRELFIDACRIRMRADVPIGTALSGGLDSSAIISTMSHIADNDLKKRRVSNDWQHAFVATFPGTPIDETYYAKKVVDNIGIKATFLEINPLKCWEKIEEYFYLFEDMYITSPIPMIETYRAMRENGIYVTIDGHGADELFSGYGDTLLSALKDCKLNIKDYKNIVNAYRDLNEENTQFSKVKKNYYLYLLINNFLEKYFFLSPQRIKRIISNTLNNPFYVFHKIQEKFGIKEKKGNFCNQVNLDFIENNKSISQLDNLGKELYVLFHQTVLPNLLRNYDRYSMINGVEIRMPFMDYRLVTYCFSLSWNSKIRGSYTKAIIRDALADFMPHEVAYRKTKIGFNSPIVDWMKNELREYFLDEVNSQTFLQCSLIDSQAVKLQIENVINNPLAKFHEGADAWKQFQIYLWEKSVIKRNHKIE